MALHHVCASVVIDPLLGHEFLYLLDFLHLDQKLPLEVLTAIEISVEVKDLKLFIFKLVGNVAQRSDI
jgi:hypothetical protein